MLVALWAWQAKHLSLTTFWCVCLDLIVVICRTLILVPDLWILPPPPPQGREMAQEMLEEKPPVHIFWCLISHYGAEQKDRQRLIAENRRNLHW